MRGYAWSCLHYLLVHACPLCMHATCGTQATCAMSCHLQEQVPDWMLGQAAAAKQEAAARPPSVLAALSDSDADLAAEEEEEEEQRQHKRVAGKQAAGKQAAQRGGKSKSQEPQQPEQPSLGLAGGGSMQEDGSPIMLGQKPPPASPEARIGRAAAAVQLAGKVGDVAKCKGAAAQPRTGRQRLSQMQAAAGSKGEKGAARPSRAGAASAGGSELAANDAFDFGDDAGEEQQQQEEARQPQSRRQHQKKQPGKAAAKRASGKAAGSSAAKEGPAGAGMEAAAAAAPPPPGGRGRPARASKFKVGGPSRGMPWDG